MRDKISKRKISCCKKTIKVWNMNMDNIVISKVSERKTNSWIGYLDKLIRSLVLIMPELNGLC